MIRGYNVKADNYPEVNGIWRIEISKHNIHIAKPGKSLVKVGPGYGGEFNLAFDKFSLQEQAVIKKLVIMYRRSAK